MNYTIWVTFDLSEQCGMKQVNEFMHSCGFTETARALSRVPVYSLSTARKMTSEEIGIYIGIFENHLKKSDLPLKVEMVEIE